MSDQGRELLAGICEDPDDDARRLVYADWLDEHGDAARAEAIRLSVRLRQMDDLDPEQWALKERRERLVKPHADRWREQPPKLPKTSWRYPREGLVDSVSLLDLRVLAEHQDAIFAAGPVTHLEAFVQRGSDASPIAACRYAGRLRHLELHGDEPKAFALETLAGCPALAKVRSLDLSENALPDRALTSLARCPAWPSLERLNLYRGLYEAPGMRALASAPIARSLRSLNLSRCHTIKAAGLRALLRSEHLTGLRELNLAECQVGSRVIKDLFAYPWQGLERLDLSSNDLTAAGVRHVAGSLRMATVRSLNLGGNHHVNDDGAVALARSPHLGALVALDLGFWELRARGVRALAEAPWMKQMRRLELCGFTASAAGLEILAGAEMPALRWLDLCYSHLGDEDLRPLLGAAWLPRLTFLELGNNELTAAGAKMLAEADGLEGLVSLNVTYNEIGDEGKKVLRRRFGERVRVGTVYDD